MWPAPYTETFLRTAAQGTTQYTVPAGKRALVTHFACMNFAAPPAQVWVVVAGIYVAYLNFPAQNTFNVWTGLAVAYAGQTIAVMIDKGGMHSTVSGKLLSDTSGATAAPGEVRHISLTRPEELPSGLRDLG